MGKKFILYQEPSKKRLGNKSRKEKSSSNSLDNNNAYSNLDNSDTHIFTKKELGYFCVYLNKKKKSLIKQGGTLFNTRVETYITISINDFNISIYILATLLLINTVGGQAKPLSFSKRTIIYTIDIKEKTYTLNLSKVQYLPDCSINIFKAKKLLSRGNI